MVNAKLHIICGNCGSNNGFEFSLQPKDPEDGCPDDNVFIYCDNCSTLHSLLNNAQPK